MTKRLKAKDLSAFCESVITSKNINLPLVARRLGFDFFEQIKPEIENNVDFRAELGRVLELIKYELNQALFDAAMNGRPRNRPAPEIQYIKAVTQVIDSGTLIGVKPTAGQGAEGDGAGFEEHKKRLGL